MGFSLYSFRAIDAMRKAIGIIKNKGGTISFDPNLRKEIFSIQEMEQSFGYIMEYTDIFLLSEKEVRYFNQNDESEQQAILDLLKNGIKHIVLKGGANGANYYGLDDQKSLKTFHVDSFSVGSVDPTCARGCFGATFVGLLLAGYSVETALKFVNVSGAVSKLGPIDGTS